MRLTKTWLSYIVWGIFSIVFFADIGIAAIEIYQKDGTQEFLMPVVTMYVCAIAGIVLCIVLYKLYEKFILPNMDSEIPVLQGAFEVFAFALFIFVAISVRIIAVISAGDGLEGITDFYEYAISGSDGELSNIYSNGVYIYCGLLKFILSFLGHIPSAAMAVQAGIQIVTIVVMYLAVKKAIGRLPAWVCCALLAFLPGSFFGVRVCTPDALYTLFFSLFLLALVYLCEANRDEKIKLTIQSGLYVGIGVFAAFLAYYDIVGLIAVIITIVALMQFRNEDAWMSIQRPWLQILLFIISFVFSLFLMLWFLPFNGLEVGPEAVLGYFKCFIPDSGFNLMILSPHKGQWDCLALFIMSGIWFVSFLRSKRDKAFPYALMIVVMTICSFFGIGTYEYAGLVSFAWIMLATIGITSLKVFRKNAKEDVVSENRRKQEARKAEGNRNITTASSEKSERTDKRTKKTDNADIVLKPVKIILSEDTPDEEQEVEQPIRRNVPRRSEPQIDNNKTEEELSKTEEIADSMEGSVSITEENVENVEESVRKTGQMTSAEESNKQTTESTDNVMPQDNPARRYIKVPAEEPVQTEEVPDAIVAEVPLISSVKTSVKTVEEQVAKPVESKPAYSYESPTRRPLRYPSKSTFTSEELEKISRHTGVIMHGTVVKEEAKQSENSEEKKIEVVRVIESQPVKEEIMDEQVQSEKKTKLIRNPLPGPKPHVPKELNYDYEPKDSEMEFDLDDLVGKDYYDL